jgi:branched-chain amino acid transport system ATP-binding protein
VLLRIENLSVSYGAIRALRDVSLEVNPREIVTLIGANGAGKTTLLRTISGLLRPSHGSILWNDAESGNGSASISGGTEVTMLQKCRPHRIVRLGISHSPEGRQIFPALTTRENLMLGAYQQHDRRQVRNDLEHVLSLFPILEQRQRQRAGTLSGGEQQMLAIGRALMQRPRLLLLDEPSLGLAPMIVRKIFEIIRTINAEGTTLLLVEQNAKQALSVADRAYVLQTGTIVKTGKAAELLQDPDVQKAYLGG